MNFFLTAPDQREPNSSSLSVEEIRSATMSGSLTRDALVFPADGSPAVTVEQVISAPPPLPSQTKTVSPASKKSGGAGKWIAISLGIFTVFIGLAVTASLGVVHLVKKSEMAVLSDTPMAEERAGHQTEWIENENYEADGPAAKPDGEILELVHYPSKVGDLAAYLSPDPGDRKQHPVIIWSKGGFGGIGDFFWDPPSRLNDQSARAFREAGIVLMCPSYRGENDNPGQFELFYGEVDDFLSAVEYAKKLPYVDPDRVYIGGHSTGGTISLLAAATGIDCRAVFSFGGEPNLAAEMSDEESYDNVPYDRQSELDHQLRSPIRYTSFIKSPTYYIEGGYYDYSNGKVRLMERLAQRLDVPFKALIIDEADHFDILTSSTRLIAKKILADTEDSPISLTTEELSEAWLELNDITLTSELERWIADGGDLKAIIENLETDIEIISDLELQVVKKTINHALATSEDTATDIGELAEVGDYIDDEDLQKAFIDQIGPILFNYISDQLAKPERTEAAEDNCLRIAGSFAYNGDPKVIPHIIKLGRKKFAPKNDNWDYIFNEISDQSKVGRKLVKALQKKPLSGSIAERLLDEVNNTLVKDQEAIETHPYNSDNGFKALQKMIKQDGDETFHATLALAFIDEPYRKQLLPGLLKHPRRSIRMEAAWVDVKTSGTEGLKILKAALEDPDSEETAKLYLKELGYEDEIPKEAIPAA